MDFKEMSDVGNGKKSSNALVVIDPMKKLTF